MKIRRIGTWHSRKDSELSQNRRQSSGKTWDFLTMLHAVLTVWNKIGVFCHEISCIYTLWWLCLSLSHILILLLLYHRMLLVKSSKVYIGKYISREYVSVYKLGSLSVHVLLWELVGRWRSRYCGLHFFKDTWCCGLGLGPRQSIFLKRSCPNLIRTDSWNRLCWNLNLQLLLVIWQCMIKFGYEKHSEDVYTIGNHFIMWQNKTDVSIFFKLLTGQQTQIKNLVTA